MAHAPTAAPHGPAPVAGGHHAETVPPAHGHPFASAAGTAAPSTTPRPGSPMAARGGRPLSPHLQVYRLPFIVLMSITTRITGVAAAFGAVFLVAWLVALAAGPEIYAGFASLAASPFGTLVLVGWTWALWYHTANGVRHLFWDMGHGYRLEVAEYSGYAVVLASALATALTWLLALTA